MPISNIRWGAAAVGANTGADGVTPQSRTAAFPTAGNAPVQGDLLIVVARSWRLGANPTTSYPSTVLADTTTNAAGWQNTTTDGVGNPSTTPTGTLVTHAIRHRLYYHWYAAGMAEPVFTYLAGTATDYWTVQLMAMSGAFMGGSPFDQYGVLTAAAANNTTTIGPAPALPNPVPAGGAVVVLLDKEFPLSTGTVPTVTGDGLTWNEASESGVVAAGFGWANDWALVPAATTVTAKQATITTATTGKGLGHMFSILPASPLRSSSTGLSVPVRRASVI